PIANGPDHDHVDCRKVSDKEQERKNVDKVSAREKYQIDDRQDQHGDKTYNRAHDIQRRSIVFSKWPRSPKTRELETGQFDETDWILGDVFHRGIVVGAVARDDVGDLLKLQNILIGVAHSATLILGVVAAVQCQICSE